MNLLLDLSRIVVNYLDDIDDVRNYMEIDKNIRKEDLTFDLKKNMLRKMMGENMKDMTKYEDKYIDSVVIKVDVSDIEIVYEKL